MENTISIIEVLDKQIADTISDIQENTIKVGDLFLKVHNHNFTSNNIRNVIMELDKMSPLINRHEHLSAKLETLQSTKYEIEQLKNAQ